MHRAVLRLVLVALWLGCTACAKRQHQTGKEFSATPGQPDETPTWEDPYILPPGRVATTGARIGLFWAWLLPVGGVIAFAALWERIHRQHAKDEEERVKGAALRRGSVVLQGVVETDNNEPAIVVTILQERLTFRDKQGNTHEQWKEASRQLSVRPFRLVLPDQRRVQVEPDLNVLLRDEVEAPEVLGADRRQRCVRLQPGEQIWATGQLDNLGRRGGGAYREEDTLPTLKPERFSRMILSTEPPGAYFTERTEFHRGWRRGALVVALLVQTTLLGDFTLQTLWGHTEDQPIARLKAWKVWTKPKNERGRWVSHFALEPRGSPWARVEEHEVHAGFYRCAEEGRCQTIPTTRAWLTAGLLCRAGRGPSINGVQIGFAGLAGWTLLVLYTYFVRSSRPWYAGGKISDPSRQI